MRSNNKKKHLHNALRAFLEGEENCSLQWIKEKISQSGLAVEDLLDVFQACKHYGDEYKYREIFEICHEAGFEGHLID
jgi:hypothetical protein